LTWLTHRRKPEPLKKRIRFSIVEHENGNLSMASQNRPLSPHLQVYKPQLTSVMSIMHRATGIALAVGTLLLLCWLIAAATGERAFNDVQAFNASWIGRLLLLGWSYALFYHLCNGIRHLFWDAGKGFELDAAYRNGWLVVAASVVLTAAAWIWGYASMGAF
jgi:succinate dehydrogenase / fumarate reductase cytochrome b subunit